MRRGDGIPAQP